MAQGTKQGLITNFATGEISPLYYGRVETDFYKAAAKELLNGIIVESGAFIRRPGTRFSGTCNYQDRNVRLVALPDGDEQFMVEFGDLYVRFFQNGNRIENGGVPVTISTTWTEDQIFDLSIVALDGELLVAYGAVKRIIHGVTSTDWSIEDIDMYENKSSEENPPTIDEKDGAIILRGATNLAFNTHRFRATDVDQRLYLKTLSGKEGYFKIGSFEDTKQEYRKVEDPNDATKFVEEAVDVTNNYVTGTYTDLNTGGAITTSDTITEWAVQPVDITSLSPYVIGAVNGRIVLSGFSDDPRKIMGSVIGKKWTFRQGVEANLGYSYTLKEDYGNKIQWFLSGREMVVGTDAGVFTVQGNEVVNPSVAFNLVKQSSNNVSRIPPLYMGDKIIYVQQPKINIRMFSYSEERQKYNSPSITGPAEHRFRDGIVQVTYQQDPYEILWVVTADGLLHSFCFNENAKVAGWTTHETVGKFLSVVSVNGTGQESEVYTAVQRERNGTWYTHIEKIEFYRLDKWNDCWYVDSGTEWIGSTLECTNLDDTGNITFVASGPSVGDVIHFHTDPPGVTGVAGNEYKLASGSGTTFVLNTLDDQAISGIGNSTSSFTVQEAANTFSLPAHFYDGETVDVFTDKGVLTGLTVSGGSISLEFYPSIIRAGYPFTTRINTLPVPLMMKERKRVYSVGVYFFESNAGYLKDKHGDISQEIVMDSDIVLDGALNMWTGVKDMAFVGGRDKSGEILIESSKPSPMNIMAINYEVEV